MRGFDKTYVNNTRSNIIKEIAEKLDITEDRIIDIKSFKDCNNAAAGFSFNAGKNINIITIRRKWRKYR